MPPITAKSLTRLREGLARLVKSRAKWAMVVHNSASTNGSKATVETISLNAVVVEVDPSRDSVWNDPDVDVGAVRTKLCRLFCRKP